MLLVTTMCISDNTKRTLLRALPPKCRPVVEKKTGLDVMFKSYETFTRCATGCELKTCYSIYALAHPEI